MYHIGIVKNIQDEDTTLLGVQATVEMWDENIIVVDVNDKVRDGITEGAYVLLDYSPMPHLNFPVPKQEICRVLDEKSGKKLWDMHKERFDKLKLMATGQPSQMGAGIR